MSKEVSLRSSKNEILDAYNELLAKIKEQKIADRKVEKKKEDEEKIVESAIQSSDEKILKGLTDVKLEIVKQVDSIGEQLMNEHKKLTELQQAIEIEKKYLDEIYEIKINVDSLSALLAAQKEKKAAVEIEMQEKREQFDEEMIEKKLQWRQEQDNYELQKKERDAQSKKDRQREEEEYNYNVQLKRKKDADIYDAQKTALEKELTEKKAAVEKELAERETAITSKEKEFAELKAKVDTFPVELERVKKETEKLVTERIEFTYKHDVELSAKEIDGDRKLNKQIIVSLEAKIKEQEELIKQLTLKTNEAGLQVQAIAIKAIEVASSQRAYISTHEKTSESSKS